MYNYESIKDHIMQSTNTGNQFVIKEILSFHDSDKPDGFH